MKPKKTISANVLTVGIITLLMVGSLVIFQIYSALTRSQVSSLQEKAIKPLDGSIKEEVIQDLINRRWFNRGELNQRIIINIPTESLPIESPSVESPSVENPPIATETGKVEEE